MTEITWNMTAYSCKFCSKLVDKEEEGKKKVLVGVDVDGWSRASETILTTTAVPLCFFFFFFGSFCCNNWWLFAKFKECLSWVQDCPQGQFAQVFLHSVCLLVIQTLKDLHLTRPLCEIQGLNVHHLLQPVQGQPTSLALLCSYSSYGMMC